MLIVAGRSVALTHPVFDKLITIQKDNASVSEIFREIEKQTGYFFVFSKEDVNPKRKIDLNVKNEPLETALQKCCAALQLIYVLSGNNIILKQQQDAELLENSSQLSVLHTISGKISDPDKHALAGVLVFEKGKTDNAVFTDSEGNFTLILPPTASISVHYLGLADRTIPVQGKRFLSIVMETDTKMIDEIVVVGYGTQRRMLITGSVASVAGKILVQAQRPDLTNTLAGNLSGVRGIQRSGRPGYDGSQIDIRGYGDEILVIVDGIERPFSQIDPNEIESVSVLKDASAAVYGIRGANGALLISTKKGQESRAKIAYHFNCALQNITRYPAYMNVWDYMNSYNEACLNLSHQGQTPAFSPGDIAAAENTDWQKTVLKDVAPMQQHNLNISGGTRETKYFFSLGYLNQDGILKTKDNFQRFNLRSNIGTTIADHWKADLQIGGRREVRDAPATVSGGGSEDNFSQGIFKNLVMALPYKSVYANNNSLYYNDLGSEPNPMALLDRNLVGTDERIYEEWNGQFALNYNLPFVEGLALKAQLAYDRQNATQHIFKKACSEYTYNPIADFYEAVPLTQTTVKTENLAQNTIFTQQYSLHYDHAFSKHHLTGLLLLENRRFGHHNSLISGEFTLSSIPELDAAINKTIGGSSYQTATMGIIGRFHYGFADKYFMEYSFRNDGVSKFLKNDRWVFTQSLSAGWLISEEKAVKENAPWLDNLKIRASYGVFPLASDLNEYYFLSGYNYPGKDVFGSPLYFVQGENNLVLAATDRGLINPYLTWEKVKVSNIGGNIALWREKLYTEWDLFYRMHSGMYATRASSLPTSFGAEMPDENLNSESDRGFEWIVGSKQRIGSVLLDTRASFSYARKKREYQELAEAGNRYAYWESRYREDNGHISKNPYRWDNISFGYEALGQFQNFEEILHSPIQDGQGNTTLLPGDIKYRDLNNDGVINQLDIAPIGRSDRPEIFFGLNVSAAWKNFDCTLFFQGAANYTYYFNYKEAFAQGGVGNAYAMYNDRWHRADANDPNSEWIPGRFPALRVEGYGGNSQPSTFWNMATSYLRLKTVDLGYSLPPALISKAGIQTCRVYVGAYNLLTFTRKDLKDVDPEGALGAGMYYPQMKTINFGINVGF
ncbi:MAG: TonB-dependent receptor [Candidatus Symbiothrix sp.]|nr:TonB-dependent receptor [Candidatus Symbiothrix sp.]